MASCRESSNSITRLVKIVAREVVEEVLKEKERTAKQEKNPTWTPDRFGAMNNIKNSVLPERAGQDWSQEEDDFLISEMDKAVKAIAQNHKRNSGAIYARVGRKGVFRCWADRSDQ